MMSKAVLILLALVAAVMAAPPLEKESHDEAYNSIISQYYTTDPFFAKGRCICDVLLLTQLYSLVQYVVIEQIIHSS